jgi:hypothetical protein
MSNQIQNYATLSELKDYLWITSSDTSKDSLLTDLLNSAYYTLNHLIWVDTLNQTQTTELIESRKIYTDWRYYRIYLTNKPVHSIDKINDVTYSWVKWQDYMVIYDRKIMFKSFALNSDFDTYSITYTAWYNRNNNGTDELPDDIKLMQMMLVSGMRNTRGNEWIQSYHLGDESITFWEVNWKSADEVFFSFTVLLNRYKNFNLP